MIPDVKLGFAVVEGPARPGDVVAAMKEWMAVGPA
jgi:hypothetical protein